MYKKNPVGIELFSHVKGDLREKNDLFLNDLPTFVVSIFD